MSTKGKLIMKAHYGIASLVVSCVFVSYEGSVLATGASVSEASITDQGKILWNYNAERCLVNPPARGMKAIAWDSGLATAASNMAKSCTYTGNQGSQAAVLKTDPTITFDEALSYVRTTLRSDYDYDGNKSRSGNYDLRPYKQMVLAKETKVGCALAVCPNGIYDTINKRPLVERGLLDKSWMVCKYYDDAGNGQPYTRGSYNDTNDACPQALGGKMQIAFGFLPAPKKSCVSHLKVEDCSGGVDKFLVIRTADAQGAARYQIFNATRKVCFRSNGTDIWYGSCGDQDANFSLEKRTDPYMAFKHVSSGLCLQMVYGAYGSTFLTKATCNQSEAKQQFTFNL